MAKRSSLEDQLDRLAALRADPSAPAVRDELARALLSKTNLVAAKAAALVTEFARNDLAAELVAAFERFVGSAKLDPGCAATTAIATALFETDERAAAEGVRRVFLRGIRHVQREPRWGGSEDVAAALRGVCALGVVKIGYRGALLELTDLLSDPEPAARGGAARALGHTGQEAATLLLRLHLARRDASPDVTAECLSGVMRLSPPWAMEYVARFLTNDEPPARAAAALALGESRHPEALAALRGRFGVESDPEVRGPLALAVAMLRTPEAIAALVEVIAAGRPPDAAAAVDAMKLYRNDATVRAQVATAVARAGTDALRTAFQRAFPGS